MALARQYALCRLTPSYRRRSLTLTSNGMSSQVVALSKGVPRLSGWLLGGLWVTQADQGVLK